MKVKALRVTCIFKRGKKEEEQKRWGWKAWRGRADRTAGPFSSFQRCLSTSSMLAPKLRPSASQTWESTWDTKKLKRKNTIKTQKERKTIMKKIQPTYNKKQNNEINTPSSFWRQLPKTANLNQSTCIYWAPILSSASQVA